MVVGRPLRVPLGIREARLPRVVRAAGGRDGAHRSEWWSVVCVRLRDGWFPRGPRVSSWGADGGFETAAGAGGSSAMGPTSSGLRGEDVVRACEPVVGLKDTSNVSLRPNEGETMGAGGASTGRCCLRALIRIRNACTSALFCA